MAGLGLSLSCFCNLSINFKMKKNYSKVTKVPENNSLISNYFVKKQESVSERSKNIQLSKDNYFVNKESILKKRKDFEDTFSPPHKKVYHEISNGASSCNIEGRTNNVLIQLNSGVDLAKSQQNRLSRKNNQSVSMVAPKGTEMTVLNMDFDDWEDDLMETCEDFKLDLTEPHHCKIHNISHLQSKIILTLISTKDKHRGLCHLEGFWIYTNLKIDDTVYVTAKYIEGTWVINNEFGLFIVEPDLLISSTALVGSLWCKRKSILSEQYSSFDTTNQAMLVGNIVHKTFQFALKHRVSETAKLEEVVRKFIKKERTIRSLYECGISLKTIEEEVFKYVPQIQDFLKRYVNSGSSVEVLNKDNWNGKIGTIEDIEENIWCPELGIKGKIDVTIKSEKQIMPLELKTGKAKVSLEHRGQIMLYLMMMKKVGYNITSGLLLYLKDGILKEIPEAQNEERGLVRLRNELVYYLSKIPVVKEDNSILPPELPEPINHSGCSYCPYKNICTMYAHFTNEDITSKKHLKKIQQETLEYCSQSHIEYFIKWSCLLIIESKSNSNLTKNAKEIYLLPPEEREQNGRCLTNLKILEVFEELDEMIEHSFEKIDNSDFNFLDSGILKNNYVVVSTEKRYAVAAGFVNNISSTLISVSLERNLSAKYKNQRFTIDSYDSSMIQSFQFSSIALLLENSPKAEHLRKIIIDKVPPTFKPTLPKIIGTKGKNILKRLNIVQQRAVLKAITANEYFLIKGMPGTGKTATIVALIQLLCELGKTVLITSHTNSAVDNVCLKLLRYGVKFIRLGSESRIHKDLLEYSEHNLTKNCSTPEEYEKVYHSAQIIAVTCVGSSHPVLSKRSLDFCIVDESTQVLQSSVIRPLYACKTFILIGDPDQLSAVVKNTKAKELGMSESLFERLYRPEATIALNINYRMNETITCFANCLTYNGELCVGNENVKTATIFVNTQKIESDYKKCSWIFKILDNSLENAVQFLDTGPVWNLPHETPWKINKYYNSDSQDQQNSKVNIHEAAIIFKIIKALLKGGIDPNDIGVIASYRHQVEQLSAIFENYLIDINTVDQFQGKDKNIIIYSAGSSRDTSVFKTPGAHDILEDKRRLNVAITRAKHKLIIVGDVKTLLVYSNFKKLLDNFENNVIRLFECNDFLWENVLDLNSC